MGKKEEGLYHKFDIRRTDGQSEPGQKHDNCDYFVLDLRQPILNLLLKVFELGLFFVLFLN